MKNRNIKKKSQIWVSVIIYTLVSVLALTIVLNTGMPIINELRERASFNKIKDNMLFLDNTINDISKQAEGSQQNVFFDVKEGEIYFKDDSLIWEIETSNNILKSKTSEKIGNLIITNSNVQTIEYDSYYIFKNRIKNDSFEVKINKINSKENPSTINTSQIISYIKYNDNQIQGFDFFVNKNETTSIGNGYIDFFPKGNNSYLSSAKAIAYVNTTLGYYEIEFSLKSNNDFFSVKLIDFIPN
ncbi:MAG: hypothetical protein QW757_01600 [Candidatus Woesearchaeota archaeon]